MPVRVTKRRPSWSEALRRAAALACGLLLWQGIPAGAAPHKPSGKPVAARPAKTPAHKVVKPHPRKGAHAAAVMPTETVGAADIRDDENSGLHGAASFYGHGFQGRRTSTGERFDVRAFTAASNHFPLGSQVAVRRLDSGRCAIVKVNDRMHTKHRRRVIDVSRSTAEYLDMIRAGVVLVRVAPLKAVRSGDGANDCLAAFMPEVDCPRCSHGLRLPEFDAQDAVPHD